MVFNFFIGDDERQIAYLTHPVIASLDHPLSAARKEGIRNYITFQTPSFRSREEAGGESNYQLLSIYQHLLV
jgi:hypothetical protein